VPKREMTAKTGNANIVKQGHTATQNHGSDPNFKGRTGSNRPRDLSIK